MIREICKDETFLAQKAAPATAADLGVAQDLMETLIAHKDGCVGMAANMIGVNKRIIAFENDGEYMVMFNPVIVKQSGAYETDEGCLSLSGCRTSLAVSALRIMRYCLNLFLFPAVGFRSAGSVVSNLFPVCLNGSAVQLLTDHDDHFLRFGNGL